MEGRFAGKTEFPSPPGPASYYLITDSGFIGYYNNLSIRTGFALARFGKDGALRDTVPSFLSETDELSPGDISGISVTLQGTDTYGNWGRTGTIIIDYKNNKKQIVAPPCRYTVEGRRANPLQRSLYGYGLYGYGPGGGSVFCLSYRETALARKGKNVHRRHR
jgi:hypothetical protein